MGSYSPGKHAQFDFADIGNSSGDESAVDNQNTFLDTDEIGLGAIKIRH